MISKRRGVLLVTIVIGATILTPVTLQAQYRYRIPPPVWRPGPSVGQRLGTVGTFYSGANSIYRQYRPYDIGSPNFFRHNFPPPNWNYYSQSTGGIFVRPRNCYGPYC